MYIYNKINCYCYECQYHKNICKSKRKKILTSSFDNFSALMLWLPSMHFHTKEIIIIIGYTQRGLL